MYYTYVLENTRGDRYTGITHDIEERVKMHNEISPDKARFHRTKYKKGPWKLIFQKEFFTRGEAVKFEKFLKSGVGREWLERARRGG